MPAADFYLEHLSRSLHDPVEPSRLGSLDTTLQARVNGEVYRFARAASRDRFRRNPLRYCGILRDPVNGVRFTPDRFSPRLIHAGVPYFFDSDSTRGVFAGAPDRYAIRRR